MGSLAELLGASEAGSLRDRLATDLFGIFGCGFLFFSRTHESIIS